MPMILKIGFNSIKNWLRRARYYARYCVNTYYHFIQKIKGTKPKHLVISGCSRSGTTLLYDLVQSSITGSVYMPDQELSALKTLNRRDERIITTRPLDILCLQEIDDVLVPYRDIWHLVLIRDPRDLVSSKHGSIPNQFFQGFDYQFFVRPHVKSFSGPGIAAVADAIDRAKADGRRILIIRYEDLMRDLENVRSMIAFATGFPLNRSFASFCAGNIPEDLALQLNGVRPVSADDRPAWTKAERYQRTCRQLELFPEIEQLAVRWGYPSTDDIRRTYDLPAARDGHERGTIVAFHTDDDFYTAEAARCKKRLEQLNLPHDFTSVPKSGSWVENCARKPEFLLNVRQRLNGPLLYIDVDAFVHQDPWPYLRDYDGDMAAYVHEDSQLLSGTVLLNDTSSTVELLSEWVARQKMSPTVYDQKVLQDIINEDEATERRFNFQRLPLNLVFISDKDYPYIYGVPIIEHLQASRVSKQGKRGEAMAARVTALEELTGKTVP